MTKVFAHRRNWPADFPDVVIHSGVATRNNHLEAADLLKQFGAVPRKQQ